jgi:hypothetical protein
VSQAFPTWLAQFQERFGQMVRTPLDGASGTLEVTPQYYDPELMRVALASRVLPATDRLAIYNRQYWFRLFTVFHGAFPLTTRLLSHFTFNAYISRFLLARPPCDWDIDSMLVGFDDFLVEALPTGTVPIAGQRLGVEALAVVQAARIDSAFHRVFRAPAVEPFHPGAEHAEQLLASRLIATPAAAVLEEHWPLCELRRSVASDTGEAAVALPERLGQPRFWLLRRSETNLRLLAVEPREAHLWRLLQDNSVATALARLEQDCSNDERAELPAKAQRWLARSVTLGLWAGLDTTPP